MTNGEQTYYEGTGPQGRMPGPGWFGKTLRGGCGLILLSFGALGLYVNYKIVRHIGSVSTTSAKFVKDAGEGIIKGAGQVWNGAGDILNPTEEERQARKERRAQRDLERKLEREERQSEKDASFNYLSVDFTSRDGREGNFVYQTEGENTCKLWQPGMSGGIVTNLDQYFDYLNGEERGTLDAVSHQNQQEIRSPRSRFNSEVESRPVNATTRKEFADCHEDAKAAVLKERGRLPDLVRNYKVRRM